MFTHDGKHALLTRGGDNMVSVLNIDGSNVTVDPRPITTGMAPYTMDINAAGTLAAVSNMGRGDGDQDSVSLIDLTSKPFRVVETVGVPSRSGAAEVLAGRQVSWRSARNMARPSRRAIRSTTTRVC